MLPDHIKQALHSDDGTQVLADWLAGGGDANDTFETIFSGELCGKMNYAPLQVAIRTGDLEKVKLLVRYGARLDQPLGGSVFGGTALHVAIECTDIASQRRLIEEDPGGFRREEKLEERRLEEHPNVKFDRGCENAPKIIRFLIMSGADPDAWNGSNETPLMGLKDATRTASVLELLRGGASLEAVDDYYGRNALFHIAESLKPSRAGFGEPAENGPRARAHLELLENVERAGGFANYAREVRSSLVVLRTLCLESRIPRVEYGRPPPPRRRDPRGSLPVEKGTSTRTYRAKWGDLTSAVFRAVPKPNICDNRRHVRWAAITDLK